jgi:hypothetical protein
MWAPDLVRRTHTENSTNGLRIQNYCCSHATFILASHCPGSPVACWDPDGRNLCRMSGGAPVIKSQTTRRAYFRFGREQSICRSVGIHQTSAG